LAQDVLEIALTREMTDWSTPQSRAWLRGVVQKRAAFVARGQARRARREQLASMVEHEPTAAWGWEPKFVASLPRSLRALATLASADLCAAEIRWILELTDTALRQRLTALRRVLRSQEETPTVPAQPTPSFGPQRAQVLSQLRKRGGRAIATQDPDGHVIFLRRSAHKS
jgi:RNA polymerase sigma-70 factor (ECF subfamily)